MVQYVGLSGAAPVIQPRGQNSDLVNLQLIQQLAGSAGQIGQQFRQQREQQALIDSLTGGGELGVGGMGPPTPPKSMVQGIPPELIAPMVRSGQGDVLLEAMIAQNAPPEAITPFQQASLDLQRQKLAQPDLPSSVREAQALGYDLSTPEGVQQYQQYRQGLSRPPVGNVTNVISGPAATIASMAPGALSDISGIQSQLFTDTGELNTTLLATMNVPGLGMAIPGTAGAQLRSAMEGAMDTMVRIRTGAAASETELAQMRDIYLPSVADTPGTVKSKLDRLDRDLEAALATATQGKGGPPATPTPAPPAQPGMVDRLIEGAADVLNLGTGERTQEAPPAPDAGAPAPLTPEQLQAMSFDQLIQYYGR